MKLSFKQLLFIVMCLCVFSCTSQTTNHTKEEVIVIGSNGQSIQINENPNNTSTCILKVMHFSASMNYYSFITKAEAQLKMLAQNDKTHHSFILGIYKNENIVHMQTFDFDITLEPKHFIGCIEIEGKYFAVIGDERNKDLIQELFQVTDQDVTIKSQPETPDTMTSLYANWNGKEMDVYRCMIDGRIIINNKR